MASTDEEHYRRSARNMAYFVGALVLLVVAAVAASAILSPQSEPTRPDIARASSGLGFDLVLRVNSTSLASGSTLGATVAINNTSGRILNMTSADSWAVNRGYLIPVCDHAWPIGVGVMKGSYTRANYTSGVLLTSVIPVVFCPAVPPHPGYPPVFFLVQSGTSSSLEVNALGSSHVNLTSQVSIGTGSPQAVLPPGIYTVVAADEWGDIATLLVSIH